MKASSFSASMRISSSLLAVAATALICSANSAAFLRDQFVERLRGCMDQIPSELRILAISEVIHVDSTIPDDDLSEKAGTRIGQTASIGLFTPLGCAPKFHQLCHFGRSSCSTITGNSKASRRQCSPASLCGASVQHNGSLRSQQPAGVQAGDWLQTEQGKLPRSRHPVGASPFSHKL